LRVELSRRAQSGCAQRDGGSDDPSPPSASGPVGRRIRDLDRVEGKPMIAHLTACILALATMRTAPVKIYHRQFRDEGAQSRAQWLASSIDELARMNGVSPSLLLALAWTESAFDRDRVSSKGARSIMQLTGRMGAAYDRACAVMGHPWHCDWVALSIAARELSRGLTVCGSELGSVSWYRSGTCAHVDTWRVQQVLALRDELAWGHE